MSKKTGIIAAIVAIVLLLGGIAGYMYYKRTPTYTFNLIKTSVEKHDWDTFSKHVDTKNVISTSYDAFLESAMESEDDVDEDMKGMVSGFAKLLKPGIVEALNDEVEQWVKTGEKKEPEKKAGSKDEQNAQNAAENMTKETGFDTSSFKGVTYTKDDGDFSLVGITIEDSQLKKDFTLELKMRQLDDGTWQILEISNLKEYLLEMGELCGRRDAVKIGLRQDDGIRYSFDMFDTKALREDVGEYVSMRFTEGIKKTINWLKEA